MKSSNKPFPDLSPIEKAPSLTTLNTFGFKAKLSVDDGIEEIKALTEEGRVCDIYNTRYSNAEYLRHRIKRASSPLGHEIVPSFLAKAG